MNGHYQHIREQLISLNVDLEDRNKICRVLENKIAVERSRLSRIEAAFADEYSGVIEADLHEHQVESERLQVLSNKLVVEKKGLMEACKALVDAIKESDLNVAAEGRRMRREADEVEEMERKSFRSSHEDRLQRFLAQKASEHKESTGKALRPEFARLQQMHEREMADADSRTKAEERRLQESAQARLEELVREEKEAFEEENKRMTKAIQDTISMELHASDVEHRARIKALQNDLERDLDRYKHVLSTKAEKERSAGQAEVRQAQEACQKRLQELRARHVSEMALLLRDHDDQTKAIKKQAEQSRTALEQQLREESGKVANASKVVLGSKQGDDEVEVFRKEAESVRDKRLQSEIRQLQAETVRLERGWKSKAEEEKNHVLESRSREEKESLRRQRHLTEQISELAVTREQLSQSVRLLNDKCEREAFELAEGQKEIEVYEDGIAAHRVRIRDLQNMHSSRARDDEIACVKRMETLRLRIARLQEVFANKNAQLDKDLSQLDAAHIEEMERLDRQVKEDVARKDDDLDLLRDAVQTEKVKSARLEALCKSTAADATTSTAAALTRGGGGGSSEASRRRDLRSGP